jgi:hypothetical protein
MNCGREIALCEVKEKTSNVCLTTLCFEWVVGDSTTMMIANL